MTKIEYAISASSLAKIITNRIPKPITSFADRRSFGKIVEHLYILYNSVNSMQSYNKFLLTTKNTFGEKYCLLYKQIERELERCGCIGVEAKTRRRKDPLQRYYIYAKPDLMYLRERLKEFKILNANNSKEAIKSITEVAIIQSKIFSYVFYNMPVDLYTVHVDYNNAKVNVEVYPNIVYQNDIMFPNLEEVKKFLDKDAKVKIHINDLL